MKQLYDADYIIRKTNEYEEQRLYNSPVEKKLRAMIAEATRLCEIEMKNAKLEKPSSKQKNLRRL